MRRALTLLAALLLAPPAALHAADVANPAKPNVLFLFSDDQRFDTIHALGNNHIRTPNLDRLAQSGTVFSNAYIMGGNSGAVCMPSRAMLMSGRTLFRIDNQLKGQTTWPEKFGRAGYSTFITGKWHNGPESVLRSFQQGRAVFLGGMGDPYELPLQDIGPDHQFINKRVSGEHSVKLFADAAIEFIRREEIGRQRWFVGVVVIVVGLRRHARIVRAVGSEVA